MPEGGGIDPEIRRFGVNFPSRGEQIVEGLAGVVGLEEGPLAAPTGALEEDIRVGVEPGDHTDAAQGFPVFRSENRPPAGGKNNSAQSDGIEKHPLLDISEIRLAIRGKDLRYAPAFGLDDHFVRIQKTMARQARHPPSDGRLAAAHEADENEVG